MWRLRHRRSRLATLSIAISGLAGDFALVVTLRAMHRLPLLVPCFDCGLLSEWWYSDAITFVQGFGIMAGLALLAHWLSRRSPSTSKA
jgi:hypothetical protein